jgi:hypothetical protein
VGPTADLDEVAKRKQPLPLPGIELQSSSPELSDHTDSGILATFINLSSLQTVRSETSGEHSLKQICVIGGCIQKFPD